MSTTVLFFSILGALMVGAMSPGPSFIKVSRIAVSRSRTDGIAAAIGIGIGSVLFSILALAGLAAVLKNLGWLYLVFKIGGSIYLAHLALRIWKGAAQPLDAQAAQQSRPAGLQSFRGALLTQLSNPKAVVGYASIFAAFLPPKVPAELALSLPLGVFAVEAGWYIIVALAFSSERPKRYYLCAKRWIDRASAAVLGMLGLRLMIGTIGA